jgi:hypothetical protein
MTLDNLAQALIAHETVEGEDLQALLNGHPLPPAQQIQPETATAPSS